MQGCRPILWHGADQRICHDWIRRTQHRSLRQRRQHDEAFAVGVERFLTELAAYIEEDFRRWAVFDKTPRPASNGPDGVIELMPTSDGALYGFKYVNGHPKNMREGFQTVAAFGVLSDVANGYPILFSEMTILTALRTAATSAIAAKYLAPKGARTMAVIGNGAQSEFQALAFRAIIGIDDLRLFDIDPDEPRDLFGMLLRAGLKAA